VEFHFANLNCYIVCIVAKCKPYYFQALIG